MPKKRKNGGKCRHNRGSYKSVRCDISGAIVPKDKAVIGYYRRNIMDASGEKDLRDACYYERYRLPKIYYKLHACISSAVHRKLVRCQPKETRNQHKHTDFHLKVKAKRRKENELIQAQRRKRNLKLLKRKKLLAKQFKTTKKDPRKMSKYLQHSPKYTQYINIIKSD